MKFFNLRFLSSFVVALIIIVISVNANYTLGYFDRYEAEPYIYFYLSPGSILNKIFDNRHTDIATNFRGREFANIFNFLDAQGILFSARLGLVHFLSVIHYLSLILISLFFLILVYTNFESNLHIPLSLLLYIYLTSPAPFMTGYYFRTSKILVSLGIVTAVFLYSLLMKKLIHTKFIYQLKFSILLIPLVAIFGWILGTTDELGIAAILIFLMTLSIGYIRNRSFVHIAFIIGLLCSYLLIAAYREVIGPYLIYRITGTLPELWTLDNNKVWSIDNYKTSLYFFLSSFIGNFIAHTGLVGALMLIVNSCLISAFTSHEDHYKKIRKLPHWINIFLQSISSTTVLLFAGFTMLTITIHLMIGTQPVFLNPSFVQLQLLYYPLPFVTFLLLGLLLVIVRSMRAFDIAKYIVPIVLILVLAGNIMALKLYYNQLSETILTNEAIISAHPVIDAIKKPVLYQEDMDTLIGGKSVVVQFRDLLGKK